LALAIGKARAARSGSSKRFTKKTANDNRFYLR